MKGPPCFSPDCNRCGLGGICRNHPANQPAAPQAADILQALFSQQAPPTIRQGPLMFLWDGTVLTSSGERMPLQEFLAKARGE
jgi:hypothetical protein